MRGVNKMDIVGFVICVYLCSGLGIAGEPAAPPAKGLVPKADRADKKLAPSVQEKLAAAILSFEQKVDFSRVYDSAVAAVKSRFSNLPASSIDALVFLILQQASRDMDEDLRAISDEIKTHNNAKQKLRDLIKALNEWITQEMSKMDSSSDIDNEKIDKIDAKPAARSVQKAFPGRTPETLTTPHFKFEYVKAMEVKCPIPRELSQAELRLKVERLKAKMELMDEMTDKMSLHLHIYRDRYTKIMQALSNIPKTTSETAVSIIQNLK
jgi:hypothetical protein